MQGFLFAEGSRKSIDEKTVLLGTAAIALLLANPATAQNTDRRPKLSGSNAAQPDRSQPATNELKKDHPRRDSPQAGLKAPNLTAPDRPVGSNRRTAIRLLRLLNNATVSARTRRAVRRRVKRIAKIDNEPRRHCDGFANSAGSPSSAQSNPPTSGSQPTDPSRSGSEPRGDQTGANQRDGQRDGAHQASTNQTNVNVSLNERQTRDVSAVISRERITPITNVNFSISVGTVVPRAVSLHTVSAAIVDIVPQYRGYSYFVTRDQIVIVEPSTYKIVTVVPYQSSGSTAAAPARTENQPSSRRNSAKSSANK